MTIQVRLVVGQATLTRSTEVRVLDLKFGEIAKLVTAADCKSAVIDIVGSSPTFSIRILIIIKSTNLSFVFIPTS